MKYLMITEFSAEEAGKKIERNMVLEADRKQNPEKYPKFIVQALIPTVELPKLSPDSIKWFDIVEADEKQIENHIAFWTAARVSGTPSVRKWYVPLLEGVATMTQAMEWMKK